MNACTTTWSWKDLGVDAHHASPAWRQQHSARVLCTAVHCRLSAIPLLLLLLFVAWTTPAIAAGSGYGFLSPEQLHLTLRELYQHGDKSYLCKSRMLQAAAALEVAVLRKGATDELHSLFKARNWMANWQDREVMIDQVERFVEKDLRTGKQTGVNGLDFAELPLPSVLTLSQQAYRVHASSAARRLCCTSDDDWRLETPALRIGFVSSDFGVHPVSALMRGMLALLSGPDHPDVTVCCYSLTAASSWWRRNISRHVDHMVSLVGKNAVESATIIRVHILIDLNGHTLHSGLSIFQYRLCPVQWSFLGYPMITGSNAANGIDSFVSDAVATPVESSTRQFTEKLLLLPTHYIVNDHLQMLGHTLEGPRPKLRGDNANRFVFATFSNWQKMDPSVFSAWMAIFARVPSSVLWFLRYSGHEDAEVNLKREADAHGIDGATRLIFSPLAPWVNHTHGKRAADLVLDTTLKSGHTTLLDVLCAGVPVLTLEGNRMSNRAGASALHALGLQHALTVNSLKEYVDVAVFLATHPRVLSKLRTQVEERRVAYPLLDTSKHTRNFVHALKSSWSVTKAANNASMQAQQRRAFHVDLQLRMANLCAFPNDSATAIYSSHVLEHNHFQLHDEVARTLREWWRVLRPGGALFVSAPDLHALASRTMGFLAPLLVDFLKRAGFCEIERVDNFGLFSDTSTMAFHGTHISLNVQARACDKKDGAQNVHVGLAPSLTASAVPPVRAEVNREDDEENKNPSSPCKSERTTLSPSSSGNGHIKAEIDAAQERLQRNFSIEWKKFLAYAVKIKQSTETSSQHAGGGATNPVADKSGLEALLLQSQSGLVMLCEMQCKRNKKWHEISTRYRFLAAPQTTAPVANTVLDEPKQPRRSNKRSHLPPISDRLIEFNKRKAYLCRLYLSRNRLRFLDDGAKQLQCGQQQAHDQSQMHDDAVVKLLAETTSDLHRLVHVVGMTVDRSDPGGQQSLHGHGAETHAIAVQDMEKYIRYTHDKLQLSLPFERLFVRMRWMCATNCPMSTSTIVETIQNRNCATNVPSSNSLVPLVHCPLFALTPSQLEAGLKKRIASCSSSSSVELAMRADDMDIVALKVQVNQLLAHSFQVDRIDVAADKTEARNGSNEESNSDSPRQQHDANMSAIKNLDMAPFYARAHVHSHWEIMQLDILECGNNAQTSDDLASGHLDTMTRWQSSTFPQQYDDGTLLRNEWDLLRLSDIEYTRVRLEALANAHFDRAQVSVRSLHVAATTGASDPSSTVIPKLEKKPRHREPKYEGTGQKSCRGFDTIAATLRDDTLCPDAIYALYALRVASCRAKRHRVLRLLNYFHYIVLSRQRVAEDTSSSGSSPHAASRWRVEKRQNDLVVLETTGKKRTPTLNDSSNREVIFPAAMRDLETMERHMLRIAKRRNFERSDSAVVIAIDRMEVICDIYDCELRLLEAKLQLAHLVLHNGAEFLDDAEDPSWNGDSDPYHATNVLLSLFQHRPLIDFSYAYFYESYAAEILHVELQTNLQQQVDDHFTSYDKRHDSSIGNSGQSQSNWLEQRVMIHTDLVARLARRQAELIEEAEQKWFCVTSAGERHALHQAIYEKILVTWKLVISAELSGTPVQCLQHNSDGIQRGRGWELVFPPELIMDCCRDLQLNPPVGSPPVHAYDLVVSMIHALALLERHHDLGRSVYEANVLERILAFQYDFVNQVDGHKTDANQFFFFGVDGVPGNKSNRKPDNLVTIASELLGRDEVATLDVVIGNTSTTTSKTIPKWIVSQLAPAVDVPSIDGSGGADDERRKRRNWHHAIDKFQTQWTHFLADIVRYQDLIGAEVFEFAACSPFLFLESARESDDHVATAASISPTALNAKAVQSKYADEIAEKMKAEIQQHCVPYWISLPQLKEQLKKRFFATLPPSVIDTQTHDVDQDIRSSRLNTMQVHIANFDSCAQYLRGEAAVPRYLVRVNRSLKRFRNEKTLMQTLSSPVAAACAFTTNRTCDPDTDLKENSLTRWLTSKLDQLKQDLHANDRSRRSDVYTAMGTLVATHASHAGPVGTEGEPHLLLAIPSKQYLINQFAVPLCREQPSPAFGHAVALANGERAETLRTLSSVLESFHAAVDLIRVKSSFHFMVKRAKAQLDHRRAGTHVRDTSHASARWAAHGLLERWQTHFHEEIRGFHDRVVESVPASVASCNIYARTTDTSSSNYNNKAQSNQPKQASQAFALQTIHRCVESGNTKLTHFLRCVTSFLCMQTMGNLQFSMEAHYNNSSCPQPSPRESMQRCLWQLSMQLNDDGSNWQPSSQESDNEANLSHLFSIVHEPVGSRSLCLLEELGKVQHDVNYVHCLTDWLDLQRVFVCEHIRPSLPPANRVLHDDHDWFTRGTASKLASPILDLEVAAVAALEKLWDRYELLALDHEWSSHEEQPMTPAALDDETPPLGRLLARSRDRHASRRGSFAQRHELVLAGGAYSGSSRGLSFLLPAQRKLTHQSEFLRLHFELAWLQDDIRTLERHYASFLEQRQKHQSNLAQPLHREQGSTCSPSLLALRKYYRFTDVEGRKDGGAEKGQQSHLDFSCGEFAIPASEMNIVLQDLAAECTQRHQKQTELYEHSIQKLQRQLREVQTAFDMLRATTKRDHREEQIMRESYAIDHAYQLRFHMEALKKEMGTMANRMDLERWALQCRLGEDYETKLAAMHAQLLTKQQRFDEYRVTMQHDLHVQLQGAQTQLAHQLVEQSGSLSVEMKASALANLHRQHEHDHVHHENVALKQTLLKLQSLLAMQQQMHEATREREDMLQRRHKTANTMLRKEAAQLQQHIKQLEADMSKLSQEKTCYMLNWNSLQKQTQAAVLKRRQVKIRALSAPYHRELVSASCDFDGEDAVASHESPESIAAAAGEKVRGTTSSSRSRRPKRLPDADDEDDVFERLHEVRIRQPLGGAAIAADDTANDERSVRHFQNSARHCQNEIRRLQQQLARETKQKDILMDQVVQLRLHAAEDNQSDSLHDDDSQSPEEKSASDQTRKLDGRNECLETQQHQGQR
ncbi:hypothetical protein FI667_g3324, partial [Globisporangium splendens]